MELLIDYWQFTLVGVIIIMAGAVNYFDKSVDTSITFTQAGMPNMEPIGIPTKGKGFWGAVYTWIMVTRTWRITKDFHFKIDGVAYVIPKGFVFDGASVPKFLRSWLSPMGVLLIGGLVHDFMYKYTILLQKGKKKSKSVSTQNEADKIFRDININVNGFRFINYLAYYALVIGGFAAWKGHRKNNLIWKEVK